MKKGLSSFRRFCIGVAVGALVLEPAGMRPSRAGPGETNPQDAAAPSDGSEEANLDDGALVGPFGGPVRPGRDGLEGKLIFINGVHTSAGDAIRQARATGVQLNAGAYLIYDDLTLDVVDDLNACISTFVGSQPFNQAFDTLLDQVHAEVEAGRPVYVVGWSFGALVANDVVERLDGDYADDESLTDEARRRRLSLIHLVEVGAPCEPTRVPVGSVYRLYDERDPIAQLRGEGDLADDTACGTHSYLGNYLRHLDPGMLHRPGRTVLGAGR